MAYNKNDFALASAPVISTSPAIYTYNSTVDALATIVASGYFNARNDLIKTGDLFIINATDAKALRFATLTSGVITLAAGS